eukprot:798817_1
MSDDSRLIDGDHDHVDYSCSNKSSIMEKITNINLRKRGPTEETEQVEDTNRRFVENVEAEIDLDGNSPSNAEFGGEIHFDKDDPGRCRQSIKQRRPVCVCTGESLGGKKKTCTNSCARLFMQYDRLEAVPEHSLMCPICEHVLSENNMFEHYKHKHGESGSKQATEFCEVYNRGGQCFPEGVRRDTCRNGLHVCSVRWCQSEFHCRTHCPHTSLMSKNREFIVAKLYMIP